MGGVPQLSRRTIKSSSSTHEDSSIIETLTASQERVCIDLFYQTTGILLNTPIESNDNVRLITTNFKSCPVILESVTSGVSRSSSLPSLTRAQSYSTCIAEPSIARSDSGRIRVKDLVKLYDQKSKANAELLRVSPNVVKRNTWSDLKLHSQPSRLNTYTEFETPVRMKTRTARRHPTSALEDLTAIGYGPVERNMVTTGGPVLNTVVKMLQQYITGEDLPHMGDYKLIETMGNYLRNDSAGSDSSLLPTNPSIKTDPVLDSLFKSISGSLDSVQRDTPIAMKRNNASRELAMKLSLSLEHPELSKLVDTDSTLNSKDPLAISQDITTVEQEDPIVSDVKNMNDEGSLLGKESRADKTKSSKGVKLSRKASKTREGKGKSDKLSRKSSKTRIEKENPDKLSRKSSKTRAEKENIEKLSRKSSKTRIEKENPDKLSRKSSKTRAEKENTEKVSRKSSKTRAEKENIEKLSRKSSKTRIEKEKSVKLSRKSSKARDGKDKEKSRKSSKTRAEAVPEPLTGATASTTMTTSSSFGPSESAWAEGTVFQISMASKGWIHIFAFVSLYSQTTLSFLPNGDVEQFCHRNKTTRMMEFEPLLGTEATFSSTWHFGEHDYTVLKMFYSDENEPATKRALFLFHTTAYSHEVLLISMLDNSNLGNGTSQARKFLSRLRDDKPELMNKHVELALRMGKISLFDLNDSSENLLAPELYSTDKRLSDYRVWVALKSYNVSRQLRLEWYRSWCLTYGDAILSPIDPTGFQDPGPISWDEEGFHNRRNAALDVLLRRDHGMDMVTSP